MAPALILLLLALGALAVGVLIGRYYVPDDRMLKRSARHATHYMRVIDHLLRRERDAAIAELRGVVKEHVADIAPYFALAALFRSRGEWERAIRIHQAIDLRADASRADRQRALFELGLDFRVAGMPRRATRAMEECLENEPKHVGALHALGGLYEEQGQFAEAAAVWHRLFKLGGAADRRREHHLLVAAAQKSLAAGDRDGARRSLREAAKIGESAHHLTATAELAASRNDADEARARLDEALRAAPQLAAFLVPALLEVERQRAAQATKKDSAPGEAEGRAQTIERVAVEKVVDRLDAIAKASDSTLVKIAAAELRVRHDASGAVAAFTAIAEAEPGALRPRLALAHLALEAGEVGEAKRQLAATLAQDGPLPGAARGPWRCGHCGHVAAEFQWRCNHCRRWAEMYWDIGPYEAPPPARDRRQLPRSAATNERALAEPTAPFSLAAPEPRGQARQPSSLWGRIGAWFSPRRRDRSRAAPPLLKE